MAAWDGYYSLGGVELANLERFLTYAETIGEMVNIVDDRLPEVAGLSTVVGDPAYTTPVEDRAPWVDLDDVATQRFLGLQILSVAGIDDSAKAAATVESLGRGGTVMVPRDGSREMRFSALLVGLDQEAVQAGVTWLERTLWNRDRTDRPIVPQQEGVSDLRFFEDRPEPIRRPLNRIANPDATGLGESLVGDSATAYAFRSVLNGEWVYKVIARTALGAGAMLREPERALVVPGQRWVARAALQRDAAVRGERVLRLLLRFRDQYGNVLESIGKNDTRVPEGVLYRWADGRYDSVSQMLTPTAMLTNWVVNPTAEGRLLGLIGSSSSAVSLIPYRDLEGARAYHFRARTAADAIATTGSGEAMAGEQWWARASGRLLKAFGARKVRADIVFRDSAGRTLDTVQGTPTTLAPTGTARRWTGDRFRSISEEVTGETRRVNYNPNPIPRKDLFGYAAGGNAKIARERVTVFGTPHAIRITFDSKSTAQAGLDLTGFVPPAVGSTVYLTFWVLGIQNLVITGRGFTDAATGLVDPVVGIPFTASGAGDPTAITVGIKITSTSDFLLRIGRRAGFPTGDWMRVSRIGIMSDNLGYFDGDTGTFEFEGATNESSSIAHLPGKQDLFNILLNASMTGGARGAIGHWNAGQNVTASYVAPGELGLTATAALASGAVLAMAGENVTEAVGGQRIQGGMKVRNTSAAAVSVAFRLTGPSTGAVFDGATVSIPAGGSAWVPLAATTMPRGTVRIAGGLVAKGAIPSGTVLTVDKVFYGSVPDASTFTEAMWFDGGTAGTSGPAAVTSKFDISVGGVAPERTASAMMRIVRVGTAVTNAVDEIALDQLMLTQADAVATDVDTAPVATLPAYFDGDSVSTFSTIPAAYVRTGTSDPASVDTGTYEVAVAAEAPTGAVTAELAVDRTATALAVAGDVLYADRLMLVPADDGFPDYTAVTRQQAASELERHFQDVRATAGPTKISSWTFGPDGCNGAAQVVEFTLVAENPMRLHDPSAVVPLPAPGSLTSPRPVGGFMKLEDRTGIVKNYMPQFSMLSPTIPQAWAVTTGTGSAVRNDSLSPYHLKVDAVSTATKVTISALNALGSDGGYDSAVASVWLAGSVSGKKITVAVGLYNGSTLLQTVTGVHTLVDASNGSTVYLDTHRLDITLPSISGTVDGFVFTITAETGLLQIYVANPQVTLGATAFPRIHQDLPDDGMFTFGLDGVGNAMRSPVAQIESSTIFPNKTAPPAPTASLGGFDEVGLTTYRTFAAIPAELVPRSAAAVPIARVDFDRFVSRWVRFRFYPNPGNVDPDLIPTGSWTHEWVVDQFAGNVQNAASQGYMSIVIDGVAERVWLRAWDGTVLPGDQYVLTSDGGPIGWPELRGIPWVVSVDYPTFRQSTALPTTETWWRASLALMIEE